MSASGSCVDIGMTTRVALGVWKDFFNARREMDGTDPEGHVEGQALIDKMLKREVRECSINLPCPVSHLHTACLNLR